MDKFIISYFVEADPTLIYDTWMNGESHAKMIGEQADIKPEVGSEFSMWDGYITGKNLELDPGRKIIQAWRTTEFPADAKDSHLEISLAESGSGTRVHLNHTQIPAGQGPNYKKGWHDFYFSAMDVLFKS